MQTFTDRPVRAGVRALLCATGCVLALGAALPASAGAQVPPDIAAALRRIGQIVDTPCTAKLYRPLMPKNDYNTYWPAGAPAPASSAQLYPGVTLARDVSFGAHPKDLIDIFSPEAGNAPRTVLIFVPGGAGNKIEQQVREANAFYDNIARWAAKNDMVGVTMQRHPGENWDDGGRDVSVMIQWLQANIARYKGDPGRIFIWAHSAGNGPLGVYVGHPALHGPKGIGVKGAIFMSGNPVPGIVAADNAAAGGGRGRQGGPGGAGSTCGVSPNENGGFTYGAISGPSSVSRGAPAGRGGAGGTQPAGRGAQPDAAALAARSNLPGFRSAPIAIMLARAELDPGVSGTMTAADIALHDALCHADGQPAKKDGDGNCPTMLFLKGESHMSEVFSIDTADRTVSDPILAWIGRVK